MTNRTEKSQAGLGRLRAALRYSFAGLAAAFRTEAAFRQECALAAVGVVVALALPTTWTQAALLIHAVLLVLVVELLNSAVEAAVDRISLERHELAKRAKDLGSAAVLVALVLAAIVWGLVLYDLFGTRGPGGLP